MTNRFFIADTHYGHANALTFKRKCGAPLRDFASVEEMDETMVQRHNATVGVKDTVYHLGDIAIARKNLSILARLNGRKILVRGNHDIFKLSDYTPYFEDVRAYAIFVKEGFICSHIPLHPSALERWKLNVHGHLHSNNVMLPPEMKMDGKIVEEQPDPRYLCVSVEQTDYAPVPMEKILERVKANEEKEKYKP